MTEIFRRAGGPFFAFALVTLVVACLALTRDYAVPIAVAVLIWFLINALADAIRRAPGLDGVVPRWLAQLVSVLLLFGAMALSVQVVARNVAALGDEVSGDREVLLGRLESLAAWAGIEIDIAPEALFELLQIDRLIGPAFSTAQGFLSDMALVFLYVLFLLADERFYRVKLEALIANEEKRRAVELSLARIGNQTRAYLWLMTLISLGVALMTYVTCAAVGLKGAGFWGFLAFALNFIPTLGSITAVVLPVVYGLLTLTDPVALAVLIAVLSATQFVAGEVVLPRVMGDRLNLSSVVILLVLVMWGAMWGPAGMFLAIPITVILVMIMGRFDATRPIAIVLSKDGRVPTI